MLGVLHWLFAATCMHVVSVVRDAQCPILCVRQERFSDGMTLPRAGKSTLLDILSLRKGGKLSGQVGCVAN